LKEYVENKEKKKKNNENWLLYNRISCKPDFPYDIR